MVSPPPTDWSFEPTDVRDQYRRHMVVPWAVGMDAPVAIDIGALLDTGEVPTNVSASLWKLKAYGESDHTDVSGEPTLPGDPSVTGTVISQRVTGLDRGRVYRLYFSFGAAGNIRKRSTVIDVSDNS